MLRLLLVVCVQKNVYSVLLPTYNERDNLPLIIWLLDRAFTANGLAYEVVIVEDSSPDGTYQVALDLQKVYGKEHIKILKRAGKLGLGSAYKDGLGLATGNFVFLMDADLSHHVGHPVCVCVCVHVHVCVLCACAWDCVCVNVHVCMCACV